MAVAEFFAAVFGVIKYLDALIGEAWTRWFIIVAGLFSINAAEGLIGADVIGGLISYVVGNVFGLQGFFISTFQILVIAIFTPIIFYLIRTTVFD